MTTYTLRFDLAPDNVATGGAGHQSRCRVLMNGVDLGVFESLPESGNDGVREWLTHVVDVSGLFDPATRNRLIMLIEPPIVTPFRDTAHWRRVSIEGSDGYQSFGEFPAGYPYTAAVQDGAAGADYIAEDGGETGVGSRQLNMQTGAFSPYDLTEPDVDFYFGSGGFLVGAIAMATP